MVDIIDPKDLFEDLKSSPVGGIRKQCTDGKRCGLGIACEHAQVRNESCELLSMWTTFKEGECENYTPRKELCSENDIFRSRSGRKHNKLTRSNPLIRKPPDLMVSRHIRDGRNIKGDD